jgi:hypothetical protein
MNSRGRKCFQRVAIVVAGLVVWVAIYCASYGPALSLAVRGYISWETVEAIYTFHGLSPPDDVGILWMELDPILKERFRKAVD